MGIRYLDEEPEQPKKPGITYTSEPTPVTEAIKVAKEYGPHVATGLGKDLTDAMAGLLPPYHVKAVGKMLGFPEWGTPESYQKGLETMTGPWPEAQYPGEHIAEWAGRALPYAPGVAYGLYNAPGWLKTTLGLGSGYGLLRKLEKHLPDRLTSF